jgi:RNA polymerase sigma-70 factor (ECF subfamily)
MPAEEHDARPTEDWYGVMADLLGSDRAHQALAEFKLNRLISRVLHGLGAWKYQAEFHDLRQNVLLKLIRRWQTPPLPNSQAFVSYVQSTTRHEFFDFIQKASHRREVLVDEIRDEMPMLQIDLDPDMRHAVNTCLDELPSDLREAITVRYVDDLKLEQAAEKIGKSLATFKRRLQEALEALRTCLKGLLAKRMEYEDR